MKKVWIGLIALGLLTALVAQYQTGGSGGTGLGLPTLPGNERKFLTNNGASVSWNPFQAGFVCDDTGCTYDSTFLAPFYHSNTVPGSCVGNSFYLDDDEVDGQDLYYCKGGVYILTAIPVTKVFNRTGNVVAATGDYTCDQVSGAPCLGSPSVFSALVSFTPSATTAGARTVCAALPSSPANGDMACDSGDSNKVKFYSNGAWVTVGGSGGSEPNCVTAAANGYWAPMGITGSTVITTDLSVAGANRVYLYQITVPCAMEFTRMRFNVSSAGTSGCLVNIGLWSTTSGPTHEAVTKTDCTATGNKTLTFVGGTLARGEYYLAAAANQVGVKLTNISTSSSFTGMLNNGSDARFVLCTNTLDGSGNFPAGGCGTSSEPSITSVPWVALMP